MFNKKLAEWTRLELATPGVTGRYSNQLNYHSTEIYSLLLIDCYTHRSFHLKDEVGGVDETRTRDPRRDRPVF